MKTKTLSLFNLMKIYPTKDSSISYFEKMRRQDKVSCAKCGCRSKITPQINTINYWFGNCREYFNVFTNTPLERNKIDARK